MITKDIINEDKNSIDNIIYYTVIQTKIILFITQSFKLKTKYVKINVLLKG